MAMRMNNQNNWGEDYVLSFYDGKHKYAIAPEAFGYTIFNVTFPVDFF